MVYRSRIISRHKEDIGPKAPFDVVEALTNGGFCVL